MSITAAFANLNNSIRGVREDAKRHEERMKAYELENKKLEYEINDPTKMLARQKAADQLRPTTIEVPFRNKVMSHTEKQQFDTVDRKAIEQVIRPDWEYTDDHRIVERDTGQEVKVPKFLANEIKTNVQIASLTSRLGNTQMEMDIQKLQKDIEDKETALKKAKNTPMAKILGPQLNLKKKQLLTMEKEFDSPKGQMQRLTQSNRILTQVYRDAITSPSAHGMLPLIDTAHAMNTKELKTLIEQEKDKGSGLGDKYTTATYFYEDPVDGSVVERDVVTTMLEKNMLPDTLNFMGKNFIRGDQVKSGSDKSKAGTEYPDMTESTKKSILTTRMNLENVIASEGINSAQKDFFKDMLTSSATSAEDKELMEVILANDAKAIQASATKLLKNFDARYGKEGWYTAGEPTWKNVGIGDNFKNKKVVSVGKTKDGKRAVEFEDGTIDIED